MTVLVALLSVRSVRQPGHWSRSPTVGFGRAWSYMAQTVIVRDSTQRKWWPCVVTRGTSVYIQTIECCQTKPVQCQYTISQPGWNGHIMVTHPSCMVMQDRIAYHGLLDISWRVTRPIETQTDMSWWELYCHLRYLHIHDAKSTI